MKIFILSILIWVAGFSVFAQQDVALQLAEQQLIAYNNRDIDAFLMPYSDSVKVYSYPNSFSYEGKDEMRKRYAGYFDRTPDLHCELVKRITIGNKVIDEELVTRKKGEEPFHAVAIYTIAHGKIQEVRFLR